MARPAPKNPEVLAAVIAALRSAADGSAGTDAAGAERLHAAEVSPATARRLVGTFDRLTPSLRRQALGEFADRPIVPASERIPPRGGGRWRADVRAGELAGVGAATATLPEAGSVGTIGAETGAGRRFEIDPSILDGILDETVVPTTPTYAIDYVGFVCEKETDWDRFSNSDEVYVITSAVTVGSPNPVRTEKHPVDRTAYEDVDAGEVRLGPIARCWEGTTLPTSLTVVAWEHDEGDPDAYRDEIDALVKAGLAALIYIYGIGAAAAAILEMLDDTITDAINWLFDTDDDQIDIARTHVFEGAQLDELGSRPLSMYIYNRTLLGTTYPVVTNLMAHFFSTHSGSGARYTFGFRLDRDPAFEVVEGPFL